MVIIIFNDMILFTYGSNYKIGLYNRKDKSIFNMDEFETLKEDEIEKNISQYINKHKIKSKTIYLIIKDESTLIKFISYRNINKKELENVFNINKGTYFPIDESKYSIDYKLVESNEDYLKVMIVAVKNNLISNYINIFINLKLICKNVNIYENFISNIILKKNTEDNIIILNYDKKTGVIHINNGHLKNIRIFYLNKNINKSFQQELSFFISNLENIKNIYFADNNELIYNFFKDNNKKIIYEEEFHKEILKGW